MAAVVLEERISALRRQMAKLRRAGRDAEYDQAVGELQRLLAERQTTPEPPKETSVAVTNETTCTTVCLADVVPQAIDWLWKGRIPRGAITLIDGEPGKGKGCITCDLAARITLGLPMPLEAADAEQPRTPADVVLMSAEDALAQVIRPRLDVAGADVGRVHAITAMPRTDDPDAPPTLAPADVAKLEAAIVRHHAALVVIDPLMAFLPPQIDAHRDQDVRRVLTPLARVAERTGAAVIVVRHPRKGAGTAMHRGGGSIGIGAAARSVLFVGDDPENKDSRIIVGAKENNARRAAAVRFHIEGAPHAAAGEQPRVSWDGIAAGVTADQLADTAPKATALDAAVAALREVLADGPVPADRAIEQVAATAGCSIPTVRRAAKHAGVVAAQVRAASGKVIGWTWRVPDAQAPACDHLDDVEGRNDPARGRNSAPGPGDHGAAIAWSSEPGDQPVGGGS